MPWLVRFDHDGVDVGRLLANVAHPRMPFGRDLRSIKVVLPGLSAWRSNTSDRCMKTHRSVVDPSVSPQSFARVLVVLVAVPVMRLSKRTTPAVIVPY